MARATLLVIQGADQGARFEVSEIPTSIGRGVRNDVRILDTEVSRHHANVELIDGQFRIHDLGSSNGTFVNGRSVGKHVLSTGDQVQVGRSILVFDKSGPDEDLGRIASLIDLVRRDPKDKASIVGRASPTPTVPEEITEHGAVQQAQTLANLQALYRISEEVVSATRSIEQVMQRILNLTLRVAGADRGCIFLSDAQTGSLKPQVFSPYSGDDGSAARMPVSRTIVDYVVQHGQGVRTSNAARDRRFEDGHSILQAGIREAICVPIQGHSELMGVIYIDTTTDPHEVDEDGDNPNKFSEEHLKLVLAIGRQAALAIESSRYQSALVKAERFAAMGQTITILSHHIKNILQGVRGGSYLIERGLEQEDKDLIRNGWGIVERNQGRIYDLVMDMLSYSKERKPSLEYASLNELVGDVCELMQVRADEFKVNLKTRLADDLPQSMFDKEGIHRAVLNIVTNAIDATDGVENGAVRVQTAYDSSADMMVVAISDNGAGIAEDQYESIFNVFESDKGQSGTGIGLAVSRKIIEEHGGKVQLESELGKGTRFVLAWPRIDEDRPHLESRTQGGVHL